MEFSPSIVSVPDQYILKRSQVLDSQSWNLGSPITKIDGKNCAKGCPASHKYRYPISPAKIRDSGKQLSRLHMEWKSTGLLVLLKGYRAVAGMVLFRLRSGQVLVVTLRASKAAIWLALSF